MQTIQTTAPRLIRVAEWGGSAAGLAGAGLLAIQNAYSSWGFVLFLMSNFCLLTYARLTRAKGLLLLYAGFTVTSVLGILNGFWDGLGNQLATQLLQSIKTLMMSLGIVYT